MYLVVWGLLFASPLLSLYVRTANDASVGFHWEEVFIVWRSFTIYLLLFLVHNFLLAPLLIHGRGRIIYFTAVAAILVIFTAYQNKLRPGGHERYRPHMDLPEKHDPPPFDDPPAITDDRPPMQWPGEVLPKYGNQFQPMPMPRPADSPPPITGEHDILAIIMLILMFSANIGIKGYFHSREDRNRLAELERENLEQQMAYLRYQIHPHFFMNTLNNIHALIDIDPAKAQQSILELSKMMRYVLYEGERQGVPLTKEMEFIRTYVNLMRLRYSDKVHIALDLPDGMPDRIIPPMVLISFIENAFKHGISYRHDSFINVQVTVENEMLCFTCRNSKAEKPNEEKGGVGLANVRKRLDLIYGQRYMLRINNDTETYTIELNIPLS